MLDLVCTRLQLGESVFNSATWALFQMSFKSFGGNPKLKVVCVGLRRKSAAGLICETVVFVSKLVWQL